MLPVFVLKADGNLLKFLSNFLLGLHFAVFMNLPAFFFFYVDTMVFLSAFLQKRNRNDVYDALYTATENRVGDDGLADSYWLPFCDAKVVFLVGLTKQSVEIVWFLPLFFCTL